MDEKKPRVFYWEGGLNAFVPVPSLEYLMAFDETKDGDELVFTLKRIDMTDDEFDELGKYYVGENGERFIPWQ